MGEEIVDVQATIPLDCLGLQTVNSCTNRFFFGARPMVFSSAASLSCEANACGVCDCTTEQTTVVTQDFASWSRDQENWLQLGGVDAPYCVEDDTLWIGGSGMDGEGRAAYKFKKQSCTGTPVACAKRDPEACGEDCFQGGCVRATGTAPGCERAQSEGECRVLQGCKWDPDMCSGTAYEVCTFQNCDRVPGCTWGPPVARCGGTPVPCEERDVTQCKSDGCSVAKCYSQISQDAVSCATLSTTDCTKAAGCSVVSGSCTGNTQCSKQTDANVCYSLDGCSFESHCAGSPPPDCSKLSVDACQGAYGCRIEW